MELLSFNSGMGSRVQTPEGLFVSLPFLVNGVGTGLRVLTLGLARENFSQPPPYSTPKLKRIF